MAKYWCEECQEWLEEDEVTHTKEQVKSGTPPVDRFEHDLCGFEVSKADEDNAV